MATPRAHRTYDPRFRRLIRETGDVHLAIQNGVPRSTARDWSRSTAADIVTLDVVERSTLALEREVVALRERNAKLTAALRLLVVLVKVLGITLRRRHVADVAGKKRLLRAVERSRDRDALPLRIALRILGLSPSRFHSWTREEDCALEDVSFCPRSRPRQLTAQELRVIKEMATSEDYRHVPTGTLSVLAQRLGKVFASAATWYRVVRRYRLRRPRRRVHPPRPKVGIRAPAPNCLWHIDTTVIKLLDGTRTYLHALIDLCAAPRNVELRPPSVRKTWFAASSSPHCRTRVRATRARPGWIRRYATWREPARRQRGDPPWQGLPVSPQG